MITETVRPHLLGRFRRVRFFSVGDIRLLAPCLPAGPESSMVKGRQSVVSRAGQARIQ